MAVQEIKSDSYVIASENCIQGAIKQKHERFFYEFERKQRVGKKPKRKARPDGICQGPLESSSKSCTVDTW